MNLCNYHHKYNYYIFRLQINSLYFAGKHQAIVFFIFIGFNTIVYNISNTYVI